MYLLTSWNKEKRKYCFHSFSFGTRTTR